MWTMLNKMPARIALILILVLALVLTTQGLALADQSATSPAQILEANRAAIVTLKFLTTTKMVMANNRTAREEERESEISCVMVSASGMLLCSNTLLTGFVALYSNMLKGMGGNVSSEPSAFKVLIEGEPAPLNAEIIARDSDLDLVWLQILDGGDRTFAHIAFAAAQTPQPGDPIWVLRRMGDHFGRSLLLGRSMISGITDKPRKLFVPEATGMVMAGMPAFSVEGSVIGLLVMQLPEPDESRASSMAMLGAANNLQESMMAMILPVDVVNRATATAVQMQTQAD